MPLVQILLTAASLAAVGGGTWGVDRVMDGLCRIAPDAAQESRSVEEDEDSVREAESRLHY